MAKTAPALLDDPSEVERRLAMLGAAHVRALEPVRAALLAEGKAVPFFDPLDGGAVARLLLLLLETPGPGRSAGPRFVSRDNGTPTGRNLRRFLSAAGIARRDVLIWNVVPWIVHAPGARNRAVRRAEVTEALRHLPELLARLPQLKAAVLAGRVAEQGWPVLRRCRPEVEVVAMPHPSPVIVCTDPAIGQRIAAALARVAALLG